MRDPEILARRRAPAETRSEPETQAVDQSDSPAITSASHDGAASLKIAIVSINYHPEPTGIAVYTTGMAEYFASLGHAVQVYTGFPYYPAWSTPAAYRGRRYQREWLNEVDVHRSYLYVPARPSTIKRIVHELSFTVSATIAYLFGPRPDVTVIVSPPLTIGLPVALLARLKGSATLFHVQDLQPDMALELGMIRPGTFVRLMFALERLTYAAVTRVSTISEAMLRRIQSKGIPHDKTLLFRNWADSQLVKALPSDESLRDDWKLGGKFVVLYAGNLGRKQDPAALLDVAGRLRSCPEIVFVIVGEGSEKEMLMTRVEHERLPNVVFHPPVARDQLGRLLATADVSVIPQKGDIEGLVLPSKLSNLLSSGRPLIVASSRDSDLGRAMIAGRCALVVEPGNSDAMAHAVMTLRANPEQRADLARAAMEFAHSTMNREAILDGFLLELRSLARPVRPRGARAARSLEPARPNDIRF